VAPGCFGLFPLPFLIHNRNSFDDATAAPVALIFMPMKSRSAAPLSGAVVSVSRLTSIFRDGGYSAALRSWAFPARTAQNLNSGILPNGSSAGFVSRFAAASA
jgi:hypothetical protein